MATTFVSGSILNPSGPTATGGIVELSGEPFYLVSDYDSMPPFFMSLVSDSDHWFFISSNGALTVGRKDPDHALFPYYSDDRIHDSQDQTGSKTLLRVARDGRTSLWEPFCQRYEGLYRITRRLYKSVYGNKILFEEQNHDLGMTFRYEWMTSERYGFVRRATLSNDGSMPAAVDLVDGIQNVLPCGLERRFQLEYSTLADGYKRTERLDGTGLVLFRLSSIPVDKAEPSEALRVNLAWSAGLDGGHLLCSAQLGAFRRGETLRPETDVRGQRGAYFLHASLELAPGASRDWMIVAEVGQDAAAVVALAQMLETSPDPRPGVMEDVALGTRTLVRIVASADGLQVTGDPLSAWRHFSNTLFNVMRGGIPDDGYRISRTDLKRFLGRANLRLAAASATFLDALPSTFSHSELLARVRDQQQPDLERLANEYLPLTFSRRHGDPSRPWNIFCIKVKDEQGRRVLNYEGNWRDLFQNWEAMGHAFPGFLNSMIFKFLDCSTADGYNPYRVMRDGFEWEAIDARDPWSFIGYWGDHQVIYLLKLLEASHRFRPGDLAELLGRRVFAYADLPYRIKTYDEMLLNPRGTIVFDQEAHRRILARAAQQGSDGKLLQDAQGAQRATLAEKLLLVALTKLTNYIPEAGIWMNTQRPEWNDANNALVGFGVSMVTLCYLRRYLAFLDQLLLESEGRFELAQELAELLNTVTAVLQQHAALLDAPAISDRDRKAVLDALGAAGTAYRDRIYPQGFSGERVRVPAERLRTFCAIALRHIDQTIRVNRRQDGLYHAYNLMKVTGTGVAIRRLYEMLEGQVAVLSSGALSFEASADLLDALRASRLYRADQASYILYPDHLLPHFLEMNNLPAEAVAGSALLQALLKTGGGGIVVRDVQGQVHFNAAFRNAEQLKGALEALSHGEHQALAEREGARLLDLYEQVFDHQSFTGRSGTFCKYEGLGCIYWHMVSKLLLAVDEVQTRAADGGDPALFARLRGHYREIREGIGVHKAPALYGAIPIDPYSHTPSFAGVQQPGMTGQVKEDCLTRLGEMGVQVEAGRIAFQPLLVTQTEFLSQGADFVSFDVQGHPHRLALDPGSLAFTLCQVPMVAHRAGMPRILVTRWDGSSQLISSLTLDRETSAAIFDRTGAIRRLDVYFGLDDDEEGVC
jgi:hypothetical protein